MEKDRECDGYNSLRRFSCKQFLPCIADRQRPFFFSQYREVDTINMSTLENLRATASNNLNISSNSRRTDKKLRMPTNPNLGDKQGASTSGKYGKPITYPRKSASSSSSSSKSSSSGGRKSRSRLSKVTSSHKVNRLPCRTSASPRHKVTVNHSTSKPSRRLSSSVCSHSRTLKSDKKAKCKVSFNNFGTSSDHHKQNLTFSGRSLVPDPYLELNKNLSNPLRHSANSPLWMVIATQRLRDRLRANHGNSQNPVHSSTESAHHQVGDKPASNLNINKINDEHCIHYKIPDKFDGAPQESKLSESNTKVTEKRSKEGAYVSEFDVYGDDESYYTDEMDEDDEEEGGLPQAVRSLSLGTPQSTTYLSHKDITRERQKARMEDIARSVSPNLLTDYLTKCGFLNHNYTGHSRTGRSGKRKQIGQLITLLNKVSSIFK